MGPAIQKTMHWPCMISISKTWSLKKRVSRTKADHNDFSVGHAVDCPERDVAFGIHSGGSGGPINECQFAKTEWRPDSGDVTAVHKYLSTHTANKSVRVFSFFRHSVNAIILQHLLAFAFHAYKIFTSHYYNRFFLV